MIEQLITDRLSDLVSDAQLILNDLRIEEKREFSTRLLDGGAMADNEDQADYDYRAALYQFQIQTVELERLASKLSEARDELIGIRASIHEAIPF